MQERQKHEQIGRIVSQANPENFMESLSGIEYHLLQAPNEEQKSLVPTEANFQLPEIFLRIKNTFEIEKIFLKSRLENNWNHRLDKIIEKLNQIELEQPVTEKKSIFDEKVLETMIRWRYGTK